MAGENRAASRDLHPLARKRDFNGDTSNVKGHIKICLWQSNHTITDLATQRRPKKIFFDHALILLSLLNRRSSLPNRNRRSPSPTMIVMVSPSESSRDETTSHEDFYTLTKGSLPQIDVINGVETMIVDGGCTEAEKAVDLEDIYFWLKSNLEDDKQKKISNKARHSSCVAS